MAKEKNPEIFITPVQEGHVELFLVGRSELVMNRLAEKAKQELLLPKGRKNAADKAASIKHDVIAEFRASAHFSSDNDSATYLRFPASGVKKSMATAALDLPGASKSQIGRLAYIPGQYVDIYGTPKLFMTEVINLGMNRVPDIRTRVIVPEWAAHIRVSFVTPMITQKAVLDLLNAAGIYCGIGDGRPNKGTLSFGRFEPVPVERMKKEYGHLLKQGRSVQLHAMQHPEPYGEDTEYLLDWYQKEVVTRGKAATA